jgi:hypothetical protein
MKTRVEFDAMLNRLVGFTVAQVHYYEIDYEDGHAYFRDHLETGHFIDYGVNLIDPSGKSAYITWDGTFYQYGLMPFFDTANPELLAGQAHDVTTDQEWLPFIGRTVVASDSYWSWITHSNLPTSERIYYPQDIRVTFDNDLKLYLSAAQFLNDSQTLFGLSDNVLVVFRDDVAQHHRLGPWQDRE